MIVNNYFAPAPKSLRFGERKAPVEPKFGFSWPGCLGPFWPGNNNPDVLKRRIERLENKRDGRTGKINAKIISYARQVEKLTGKALHVSQFHGKWLSIQGVPFNKDGLQEYLVSNRGGHSSVVVPILEAPNGEKSIVLIESKPLHLQGKSILMLPGGMIGDSDAGESPGAGAARETVEEIGYEPAPGGMTPLGEVNSNYVQTLHVFLASGLRKAELNQDEYEKKTKAMPVIVPLNDLYAFLRRKKEEGVLMSTNLGMGLSKYVEHCALSNTDTGLFARPMLFSGKLSLLA